MRRPLNAEPLEVLMRFITGLFLTLIWLSSAGADDKPWRWFAATSTIDQWHLEEGTAKVTLTPTTFRADLFAGSELRHRISGSRRGSDLEAKLSTEHTDQVNFPLRGKYERWLWRNVSDGSGREAITLFQRGIVIGFTREITR